MGHLHTGIPGCEPTAMKPRQKIGAVETTAPGSRGGIWLKTKHVIIIGPFTILGFAPTETFQTTEHTEYTEPPHDS